MISRLRQNRHRAVFAWLALAAVLLRSVIPAGFMPVHVNGSGAGIQLAVCHGNHLSIPSHSPEGLQAQPDQCPFAFAAMAAIPPVPVALPVQPASTVAASDSAPGSIQLAALRVRPPARAPPLFS